MSPKLISYGGIDSNTVTAENKNITLSSEIESRMENEGSRDESVIIFGKEMPSSALWIFKLRIPEICLLLLLFTLSYNGVFTPSSHKITPPEVSVAVANVDVVTIEDAEHNFPLKVDGVWCSASDFVVCKTSSLTTGCCADKDFEEEVDENALLVIAYILPLIFIVLRTIFYRFAMKSPNTGFCDAVVGFLSSAILLNLGTNVLKHFVGYPRPDYYALLAYADLHGADGVIGFANRSFPSGHSSESMFGMSFITFLLLDDLKRLFTNSRTAAQSCSVPLHLLALLPICLALYVGATRIRDYYHFPADVIAGFLIGISSSYYGTQYCAKRPFLKSRNISSDEAAHLLSTPLLESDMFKV
mmetsp:Transcript_18847/g.24338  ORF Transcript_18847/g.24338 Transcript_18847/m.24338 type:complete len:358 (+) Transcript_18847:39-1112(+)